MLDPELKTHLEKIEEELSTFRKRITALSSVFIRGVLHGAGYVVGAVIILTLIGWILNIVGIIPAFTEGVTEFRASIDRIGTMTR